jgi:hypothetical protein
LLFAPARQNASYHQPGSDLALSHDSGKALRIIG